MREKPLMPPVVWVALFAGAMIGAARLFPETRFGFPGLPWVAGLIFAGGLGVGAAGVIAFRRHATTVNPTRVDAASTLVTSGIFGVTRNPMYVGMALCVLAIGLSTGSLIALSLAPVFVVALTKFQIEPEETAMRKLFGEAYSTYAARVPRWLIV